MDTRQAKQAIYGTLYLIIIVGIAAAFYFSFFHTAPSCFDGMENQGEAGVDCGGPCAKVCIPADLKKITIGSVETFTAGAGHYTFLAEVENHNTGFAAPDLEYHFNIYSASGTLAASVPGRSFLYAGEVKYLLLPNVAVASPVDHAGLAVGNTTWVAGTVMGLVPQFGNPLGITGSTVSSSTVTVTGRLINNDVAAFANVLVVAIFYDANGNPVGASQTVIDSIAPNQAADFSIMYPAVSGLVPALTKAYAYALRP